MTTPLSPVLTKCPACGSFACGPVRCRFSLVAHEVTRANDYANACIKRDAEMRHIGTDRHDFDSFGSPLNGRES